MSTKTFASRILKELSASRRRVVSDWRILLLARRLAHAENAPLPDEKKAIAIRRELSQRGDLIPVEGIAGVYVVDVAYANLLEVSEEQIIQEANPWAVFGYLTALAYHGLTDLLPRQVYAIAVDEIDHAGRIPLGTMPDDWGDDLRYPTPKLPRKVRDVPVHWTRLAQDRRFGVMFGYSFGIPIYVTDPERTLIDSLGSPDKSGGIAKVLQAWRSAEAIINLETLIFYTDQYDNKVLRQRVGFLLDQLGKSHSRLDVWRRELQRGGSVKLVANSPYSETYSAEWNLSLNVPPSVLAIVGKD